MSDGASVLPTAYQSDAPAADAGPLGERWMGDLEENVFQQYRRVFWRRRWAILGTVALIVFLALIAALLSQEMYRSSAQLEIAREANEIVNLDDRQRSAAAVDQEFYQTQYSLLRSRSLAEKVVADLRLADNSAFLLDFSGADEGALPDTRDGRASLAVGKVMEEIEIVPVRLSSIVDVRFSSPDPQMAAAVANSLAENYVEFNLEKRYDANSYARTFLEEQLEEARKRLEDSERLATTYAGNNELINIAPAAPDGSPQGEAQQSLTVSSLASINNALNQARAERIVAENQFQQARRNANPGATLTNSVISNLRLERASVTADIERLQTNFGPEYPPLKSRQAQFREIDQQLNTETSRVRSSILSDSEQRYQEALGTERQLAEKVEELKGATLDQRRRSIQYDIYQRDTDTNKALYDTLLQQYRQAGVARGIGTNNVAIIDRALVPTEPYSPNFKLNLLLGLLAGLALGAIGALLLEQMDDAAISTDDFHRKLALSLLGSVPKALQGETIIDALDDPKSPASEAYFSILTGMQFATNHGVPRSITVTSTQASEGKSTTSYAIARILAKIGKRVVLVDGDMRNPSVHKIIQSNNDRGLSNLLAGEDDYASTYRLSEIEGLQIITAGPVPPNPSELLSLDAMQRVLKALGTQFDHIVVDAPPVLGLADSPLLARSTEAVVFIIEAERTKAAQARSALRRLRQVGSHIIGGVLTKFDGQKSGYGYGYDYQYTYGSKDDNEGSVGFGRN